MCNTKLVLTIDQHSFYLILIKSRSTSPTLGVKGAIKSIYTSVEQFKIDNKEDLVITYLNANGKGYFGS